jgi:phage terminase large subunit-like protein
MLSQEPGGLFMIMHNTRESAIRRDEFHRVLQDWLDETFDDAAGDADNYAGSAWLWVRHGGKYFYLDASATRGGVREYLRIVAGGRGEVEWQLASPTSALCDRITVGPARTSIEGFNFYRHGPRR